jgi:hypothetical protein
LFAAEAVHGGPVRLGLAGIVGNYEFLGRFAFEDEALVDLGLRLPDEAIEEFLKKYKTKLFESYGVVKKDYVTVPDSLLQDTKTLSRYFRMSYESTKTLKPKPTTKKKS